MGGLYYTRLYTIRTYITHEFIYLSHYNVAISVLNLFRLETTGFKVLIDFSQIAQSKVQGNKFWCIEDLCIWDFNTPQPRVQQNDPTGSRCCLLFMPFVVQ